MKPWRNSFEVREERMERREAKSCEIPKPALPSSAHFKIALKAGGFPVLKKT